MLMHPNDIKNVATQDWLRPISRTEKGDPPRIINNM